jgi:hypothetical protein
MLLLSDVRKQLLVLWLVFSTAILLFFLAQAQNGKYLDMETTAWGWVFAQLLPGLIMLIAATLIRFNSGKTVLKWAFWVVFGLTALLLLFVMFTLLRVSGGAAGLSLEDGFARSYRYLLPLQGLLLAIFGILFFKKENLFQPSEALLRGHAQQLLAQATDTGAVDRRQALELFVAADMPALLGFLEEKVRVKSTPDHSLNEVLLLKNNLVLLRKNTDMGRLTAEETRKEYQRICVAALGLIEEL